MLRRKVTDRLLNWKQNSNKALLVTGARQIGKSYAIREFGKANYPVYFEANLLLDADARESLTGARNASDFVSRVSLLSRTPLQEGRTLIFIDEIQEYPEIVTLMKALVEDGRYSYVFSGSMLGTEFKGISSFPVGYVERITMHPMDFEEFCWAVGVSSSALDQVKTCFEERSPVENYIHEAMLRNYQAYIVSGGMPEVVQDYIDSRYSLVGTRTLQESLVSQYRTDIGKYAGERAFAVRAIFDRMPLELEGENHRFVLSSLKAGARMGEFADDFLWLVNAGVAVAVPRATEAKAPLKRTEEFSSFKLYESDTGMLVSRYPQATARSIYLNRRGQNLGGVYENVVAQELTALGIPAWYYYTTEKGEVDFLIEGMAGHVLPIEVKSGVKVKSHAALDNLLDGAGKKIPEAVVLSHQNVSCEGCISYLPFYMSMCLKGLSETAEVASDFTFAPAIV